MNTTRKLEKATADEIVCQYWKLTGRRWIANADFFNVCWKSWDVALRLDNVNDAFIKYNTFFWLSLTVIVGSQS